METDQLPVHQQALRWLQGDGDMKVCLFQCVF